MRMKTHPPFLCSLLSLTTLLGCGGSHATNRRETVALQGGVKSLTINSPYDVTASDSPQEFYVTLPGDSQPTAYWIPAGISVTKGDPLVVFPKQTVYFLGMTGGASSKGQAGGGTVASRQGNGEPGTVLINGRPSGVMMVDGVLNETLGLPCTCGQPLYKEEDFGPFTITDFRGRRLTIGKFVWNYDTNGIHTSLPRTVDGAIPANGSFIKGNRLALTFWPEFSNGLAKLELTMPGRTVTRFARITSSGAVFEDLTKDLQIPASGLTSIELTIMNEITAANR